MPGPPPPPPMGAPPMPPPSFAPPPSSKGGPDDRSALLKSIQKGTRLKKTVTNDKSAPLISAGKVSNNNAGNGGHQQQSGAPFQSSAPNGLNLGGLFAGGMPKLRATGKLGPSNGSSNDVSNVRRNKPEPPPPPYQPAAKNFSTVQNELKKQMASDNKNRGPPPPAPVENHPSEEWNGYNRGPPVRSPATTPTTPTVNGFRQNQSSLHATQIHHRKAKSNVSLNTFESSESSLNNGFNPPTGNKPVISYGKPNLAPKPPALNGKPMAPPKKLLINGKPVGRAHSMRSPRTPTSPQSPDRVDASSAAIKFGTVRNMSSVIGQTLANSTGNLSSPRPRPALNGRPTAPPPSIPTQQAPPPPHFHGQAPPPPPPSKTAMSVRPPNHAPPPPPSAQCLPQPPGHAPPVPNHRTGTLRAPPAVPGNCAPPPPPRHSSMATVRRRPGVDLEERYRHMFQQPNTFPKPPPYRHIMKIYGCKQAGSKQPAPQPPNVQQIPAKTWGDTSSAC